MGTFIIANPIPAESSVDSVSVACKGCKAYLTLSSDGFCRATLWVSHDNDTFSKLAVVTRYDTDDNIGRPVPMEMGNGDPVSFVADVAGFSYMRLSVSNALETDATATAQYELMSA